MKMKYLVVGLAAVFMSSIAVEAIAEEAKSTAPSTIQHERLLHRDVKKIDSQEQLQTSADKLKGVPSRLHVCDSRKRVKLGFNSSTTFMNREIKFSSHQDAEGNHYLQIQLVGTNRVVALDAVPYTGLLNTESDLGYIKVEVESLVLGQPVPSGYEVILDLSLYLCSVD